MSVSDSLRAFLQESNRRTEHPSFADGYSSRGPRASSTFSRDDASLDRHTAKTLAKLVRRFSKDNLDSLENQTHYNETVEKCQRIIESQGPPSIMQDENSVANAIIQKLMHDPRDTGRATRFGHLYNKLASQTILRNKWSILYFLSLISDIPSSTSMPDNGVASFVTGLPNIPSTPHLQPAVSRPLEPQETSRNTRRRLTRDDRSLPPAFQLSRARALLHPPESQMLPESALFHDLIFIFQGIDGQYIKFNPVTNEYMMDEKVNVSQSTKDHIYRLTELGWLYKSIRSFILSRIDDASTGLVDQAFCVALQNELTAYYKLIAVLEAQVEKQTAGTDEIVLPTESSLTIKRLLVWTKESSQRLRLMSILVDACKDQKGGALVSTMHNYTKHGDPFIQQFIKNMLEEVSKPFYEMLQRWIYQGDLDDPYEEFFVACHPNVPEEELWQSKYSIREDMIPSFFSRDLAQKIFSIGKSLNFIRYSCHDDTLVEKYCETLSSIQTFKYGDIESVERSIDATYRETSKKLLDLLKQKYKLMDHLLALKRYLLLGQGDFIQHLMDTLWPGLSRPAKTLFRHNLTGILETTIRASNAQFDDPEILNRLDVRLLEISSEDLGWDVFTLDYHVDSPINTVFSPQAMHQYLRMFNFLWRLKRVEYTLTACWRRWSMAARSFASVKGFSRDLHQAQLAIGRMIHFIYQLQHYYLFEVLECSWEKLEDDIEKSIDLDAVIQSHSHYLAEISEKGFLSGAKNQALSMRLNALLDTILAYKSVLDHLYAFASSDLARTEGNQAKQENEKVARIRSKHSDLEAQFESQVLDFLDILASYHDEDLRSLSTRLDYNDYYSSRRSAHSN